MILGAERIEELLCGVRCRHNKDKHEVHGLLEDLPEDFEIEGCTTDLTLGRLWKKINSDTLYIGIDSRDTGSAVEEYPAYLINDTLGFFMFRPDEVYIGQTKEIVNMPLDLIAVPKRRVTCFSMGLSVECGFVQPNFYGKLKFGLRNNTKKNIFIQRGARLITLMFMEVGGGVYVYNGYHQGGDKITTNGIAPAR